MAVQHGHAFESRAEAGRCLRRQADLGHQYDGLPPETKHLGDRLDVHFGLAAAGDSVDQDGLLAVALKRLVNRIERHLLSGVQLQMRLGGAVSLVGRWQRVAPVRLDLDEPLFPQIL